MIPWLSIGLLLFLTAISGCTAPVLDASATCTNPIQSEVLPSSDQYSQILEDYASLGVPGISVLIAKPEGVWFQAVGQADIVNDVDMVSCHRSIPKLG